MEQRFASDDDDDSDVFDYNSCYDLIINSEKKPYLDVYDSEAANPGSQRMDHRIK